MIVWPGPEEQADERGRHIVTLTKALEETLRKVPELPPAPEAQPATEAPDRPRPGKLRRWLLRETWARQLSDRRRAPGHHGRATDELTETTCGDGSLSYGARQEEQPAPAKRKWWP